MFVGLPQRVGGIAILFNLIHFYDTHQVLVGLPLPGVGGLAILFYIIIYMNLILVYFYNAHQVLVRLPRGVGGLAIPF